MRFYRPGLLHYLIFGVRLQECYGWGRPIFSATAGVVVRAEDGWPERDPVHLEPVAGAAEIAVGRHHADARGHDAGGGGDEAAHRDVHPRAVADPWVSWDS